MHAHHLLTRNAICISKCTITLQFNHIVDIVMMLDRDKEQQVNVSTPLIYAVHLYIQQCTVLIIIAFDPLQSASVFLNSFYLHHVLNSNSGSWYV
jgi:hypothetical protein